MKHTNIILNAALLFSSFTAFAAGTQSFVTGAVTQQYNIWNMPSDCSVLEPAADKDAGTKCGGKAQRISNYSETETGNGNRVVCIVSAHYRCIRN